MKKSLLSLLLIGFLLAAGACQSEVEEPTLSAAPAVKETPAEAENMPIPLPSPTSSQEFEDKESERAQDSDSGDVSGGEDIDDGEEMENVSEDSLRTADADVEFVRAVQADDGSWTFHVTVRHPDLGWEDYANGWDVLLPDGTVLKRNGSDNFTRLLLHPHENEQPFTRSQSGLTIPEGSESVIVRAHDLVDSFGGREVEVDLTASAGDSYEVKRP